MFPLLVKVLEAQLSEHPPLVGSLSQSEQHCLQCLFLSRGDSGEVYSSQTREGPTEARGYEHWRAERCLICNASVKVGINPFNFRAFIIVEDFDQCEHCQKFEEE